MDERSDRIIRIARLLQHVRFGAQVGWTGGLHDAETMVEEVPGGHPPDSQAHLVHQMS
jgi:hypothetical protein